MSDSTAILPSKQVAALTSTEAKDLRKLESVIERGQKTFIEVGKALMEINQRKLYRDTHSTFPDYCREKWGFAKSRAYQLIESAKVVGNVHSCGQIEPPANEAQARPLAQLPVAQQANAWQDVVDECKERGEPVTAAAVADVVEKYKAQAEPYREIEPDDDEPDDDGDEPDAVKSRPEQNNAAFFIRQTLADGLPYSAKKLQSELDVPTWKSAAYINEVPSSTERNRRLKLLDRAAKESTDETPFCATLAGLLSEGERIIKTTLHAMVWLGLVSMDGDGEHTAYRLTDPAEPASEEVQP